MKDRDALEAAQQRLRQLELLRTPDATLLTLADSLEREVDAWSRTIDAKERTVVTREHSPLAASVMGFGFALVFAGPMVAMIGTVLSRALGHDVWLALGCLLPGLALAALSYWKRARRAVSHRFSGEWRRLREARAQVATLRALAGAAAQADDAQGPG